MTPIGKKKSKSKAPKTPEDLADESRQFIEDMQGQKDPGVALMGAAFLDAILEQILRACFRNDAKHVDALLEKRGPLGTLWSRSKIAYCLRLLPKNILDDLDKIRDIRNIFAHNYVTQSFDSEDIAGLCAKLRFPNQLIDIWRKFGRENCLNNRGRYILSVAHVSNDLILCWLSLRDSASAKERKPEEVRQKEVHKPD